MDSTSEAAASSDVGSFEAGAEAAAPDAPAAPDGAVADASLADATMADAGDSARADALGAPDTVALDAPPDTLRAEAGPADAAPADAGCPGTLAVSVGAPSSGQVLETCTRAGMAVYFDFTATVTGSAAAMVLYNWRNPDGLLVAPPFSETTGPSYAAHRQVGGPTAVGAPTALATAGGRNAIGGTWHVELLATDTCGRSATATMPFALGLTARSCPNP